MSVVVALLGVPDGDAGTDRGESENVQEVLREADFLDELDHSYCYHAPLGAELSGSNGTERPKVKYVTPSTTLRLPERR